VAGFSLAALEDRPDRWQRVAGRPAADHDFPWSPAGAAGVTVLGLGTLRAENFRVVEARVINTHPGPGAEMLLLTIAEMRRNTPTALAHVLNRLSGQPVEARFDSESLMVFPGDSR
jgi:hypothetical protein